MFYSVLYVLLRFDREFLPFFFENAGFESENQQHEVNVNKKNKIITQKLLLLDHLTTTSVTPHHHHPHCQTFPQQRIIKNSMFVQYVRFSR